MVGLRIKFDLGRYHANPWDSHVNDAAVEWPPSPWRLLRALYSVGCRHAGFADRRGDLNRALAKLASAPPPVFELPPAMPAHTRHYMPVPEGATEKSAKVLDGFLALDPEAELVVWWDTHIDADASDALAAATGALGYLGRSESVCTAQLTAGAGPAEPSAKPLDSFAGPTSDLATIDLLCIDAEDPIGALTTSVGDVRSERRSRPAGTQPVTYGVRRPETGRGRPAQPAERRPELALLRVRGSSRPALTEAVAAGQLLRSALQSRFGERNDKAASPTFSGRVGNRQRSDQHRHAHFFSLPDGHGKRVDRLLVWAPEGLGDKEVAALAELRTLWMKGSSQESFGQLQLALGALGDCSDLRFPVLLGPSREWTSVTPFGLVRHPKVKRGRVVDSPEEQVIRELAHRGFPEPEAVEVEPGPHWHRFRSSKSGTSRQRRVPLAGVTIRFAEAVSGPIALGTLSHYGLGLMRPAHAS